MEKADGRRRRHFLDPGNELILQSATVERHHYEDQKHIISNGKKMKWKRRILNQPLIVMDDLSVMTLCFSVVLMLSLLGSIRALPSSSTSNTGEVSFYGSSHVSLRLQEARSSSDIYFRLRTRRSDSLLFLVAGRTDYCLLVLDAGRLKVHINLGAGETEIASEAPFLLNDMKWHTVNLTRRGSSLSIQVDHHFTKSSLPSRFLDLNIHFGVWLGGLAGFNEIFLGNLPSFRGCMSHISYNGEDVLTQAKAQSGEISGVTWNCSDEFDAPISSPFSFTTSSSYVILRIAIPRQGTSLSLQFRSIQNEDGLIFYAAGPSSRPDYLALQIKNRRVYFIADTGSGPIELISNPITNGNWHSITFLVSSSSISLMIDNETRTGEFMPGRNIGGGSNRHYLDVSEMVYLGGIEDSRKNKLRALGLIDLSFRGCIRNLSVDSRFYGLPDVDMSRNISTTGCTEINYKSCFNSGNEEELKCHHPGGSPGGSSGSISIISNSTSNNITQMIPFTTLTKSTLSNTNLSQIRPSTSSEFIIVGRDIIRIVSQTALGELEIMRVSPIQVAEGDSVSITPRHLAITLDLSKFGIRESGVLFKVSKPPMEGRLEVTSRTATLGESNSRGETFSLLDVGAGRVRYYHNGAENSRDTVELLLRLVQNTGFLLPAYLQDERVITLPVDITAVNDPPEIRLVPGGVLRLAEGTKIRLLPEILTASDPDTSSRQLQFTVLPIELNGLTSTFTHGSLELSTEPGKSITGFTQTDLENRNVWYVDSGGTPSSKLALKVTDGSSVSPTVILRIETFPLRIVPEMNTGLEVANVMGTVVLLTNFNLSFTSNAVDQGLLIEYHILRAPKYGNLQIKLTNGQWSGTESFTSLELTNQTLRYVFSRPSDLPTEDEFTFHVSLYHVKVPTEFRFRFRIVPLRLDQIGFNVFILNETTEGNVGPRQLEYRTFPLQTSEGDISYRILEEPRYGLLSFHLSNNNNEATISRSLPPLSKKESPGFEIPSILTFTQADVQAERVYYEFRLRPYSPLTDSFVFNVSTPHLTDGPFKCQIHHSGQKRPASLTLKPLRVIEGQREFLTSSSLFLKPTDIHPLPLLLYNITLNPAHGTLGRSQGPKTKGFRSSDPLPLIPVTIFSSTDLEIGALMYEHDGSESPLDRFKFVAWSIPADFLFDGQLDINIQGINNNPPKPSLGTLLSVSVMIGGSRRLNSKMLEYIDADWDSDPSGIKYSVKPITGKNYIGNIYDRSLSLSRPIFSWTQADIDTGKLIFRHDGMETSGKIQFWVTDSKFTVNGSLDIIASPPWIRIVNTSVVPVKKGSIERLPDVSLRIDTNIDIDSHDTIQINILEGPHYGIIKLNGNPITNFSLAQLEHGLIIYENKNEPNSLPTDMQQQQQQQQRDTFQFQASVLNGLAVSGVSNYEITLYPEAYWAPMTVSANSSLFVKENSSVVISQRYLTISNPHIPLTDIIYTLRRPPRHGYLAIDSTLPIGTSDESHQSTDYVTMWDQVLINEGRLRYVQSESNQTFDSMNFDVTNGVRTLIDLKMNFIVIPSVVLMNSISPILVNEGNSVRISPIHLQAAQNYFADKLGEVRIIEGPRHGSLTYVGKPVPTQPLSNFPYRAIRDGKLQYVHDGSETLEDGFVVVASTVGENNEGNGNTSGSRISLPHGIYIRIIPTNDEVPLVVNNTGIWVWAGSTTVISNTELAATDGDSDGNHLVFYIVGSKGGFLAKSNLLDAPIQNFTQEMLNTSQIAFNHKGEDLKGASFEFEVSDGLNEASKETFRISIRKPELVEYEGRVPVSVFPLTQVPIRPENLLVRSSDGREINFKTSSGPGVGQLLTEITENKFVPVSTFTQSDVNNGKVYYHHLKAFRGQRANDSIRFTATSRYADPLYNVTVDMDISVTGAALGGLQRYVTISPLIVKEGSAISITTSNINLTAVLDFIMNHHKGSPWRSGNPTLRILISDVPRHGWILEGDSKEGRRLRPGEELPLLPNTQIIKNVEIGSSTTTVQYVHDDSETRDDSIGVSLWFWTNDSATSTWLLNLTLPVTIVPVNDQPFQVSAPKGPIPPVVQEHWRKLSRNDLLTSDPDTPPAHIVYEVSKISHGRFVLVEGGGVNITSPAGSLVLGDSMNSKLEESWLFELPSISRFTQADIDAERILFYHSGPITPIYISLKVSDGHFPATSISLTIPVQPLTLQASQSLASPIRIQQGNSVMTLSPINLPMSTNGHPIRLIYNVTRSPLHGKLLLRDRITNSQLSQLSTGFKSNPNAVIFSHYDLLRGELTYVQTDLSVANDSFEVSAHYTIGSIDGLLIPVTSTTTTSTTSTTGWLVSNFNNNVQTFWLVNVVSVPLLKRIKEVRSFVKGFAVGGIIVPDETEFSASIGLRSILNLAVLDASPLAAVTGSNPSYEILYQPKYGQLYKIPIFNSIISPPSPPTTFGQDKKSNWIKSNQRSQRSLGNGQITNNIGGRIVSRFSHEDIRRGSIIYSPNSDLLANDILPLRLTGSSGLLLPGTPSSSSSSSSSSMADEFIFKVVAPGVQPALGIAKFNIRTFDGRYWDEKGSNQIISDGSTDPATKRSSGGNSGTFHDLTSLVSPHMTKDSLITVAIVIAGILILTLFLIIGIRCTCVRKSRITNPNGLNNHNGIGSPVNSSGDIGLVGNDPKYNGIGIIDGYTPSTTCTLLDVACQSDSSECSLSHHHMHHHHHLHSSGNATVLRPLLMSPISPRTRHRVGTSLGGGGGGGASGPSESGSWTSSTTALRNEGPAPSLPQCRVIPLCGTNTMSNTIGSGSDTGGNSMMLCPLLPQPICDTFTSLPEEIDPPEGYGFTYGSHQPPPLLEVHQRNDLEGDEEETQFTDYHHHLLPHQNTSSTATLLPGSTTGTLRRTQPKNQYWV